MIMIGVFFLIDLLKEGSLKKIAPKYVVLFGMVAVYFYAYMYITDKISYNSDWYYEMQEYIFRSMHVRFSIYATLHPEKVHILDYPGQSMLYSFSLSQEQYGQVSRGHTLIIICVEYWGYLH